MSGHEIARYVKRHMDKAINNAFCITTVEYEERFRTIRVFTDGILFVKGILSMDEEQIQIIWDCTYPREDQVQSFKFYCSKFGEPLSIGWFTSYCIDEHLKKFPHHRRLQEVE